MTEAELAESIYWEAEQYIPFDIQDVNLDYQILDPGTGPDAQGHAWKCCSSRRRRRRSPTTPASSPRPGRTPVVVDVDAFALQNAYEVNYGLEPGAVVVLLNAGASAININILARRPVGLHARHLDRRQRLHRGGAEGAEPAVRERRAAEEGHAGRRRDLRGRAAGAARDDRERAARNPEDVRLLQGDGVVRSDRPHHAERRRVARRRLRRGAARAVRHRRSSRSIRSSQVAFDAEEARRRRAPTTSRRRRRWPSGLALRKAGDR